MNSKSPDSGAKHAIYSEEAFPSYLPSSIIDDNEGVALALVSEDGLVRKDGYRRNSVDVPVGMVVTDRHLVFAAVGGDGADAGKLAYGELAGVDVDGETLVFTTTDGVSWRFPLAEPESEATDIAVRHLCWIGEVRNRVVSAENDLELASGKIRTLTADFAWEGARETYRDAREQLDALVCLVQCTTPLEDGVLAPELTDLDRTLESACARMFVERSRSQLELASQLLQYGDYGQARKVFDQAKRYRDRARWHAEEVKRADAFQFGRQRDLASDLEELEWEIESTATEPLHEAEEATVKADVADAASTEIEHLETALDWYRGIRTLGWESYLGTAASDVRSRLEQTATWLVDSHEQAARDRWNEGSRREVADDLSGAIRECTVATEHLERAHELAEEFDPERATQLESRLKQMFEMLLEMQDEQADKESGETEPAGEPSLEDVPDPERRHSDIPTLEDLADVDLHHDITLDLEGDADPLDLSEDHEDDPLDVKGDDSGNLTDEQEAEPQRQSNETESV